MNSSRALYRTLSNSNSRLELHAALRRKRLIISHIPWVSKINVALGLNSMCWVEHVLWKPPHGFWTLAIEIIITNYPEACCGASANSCFDCECSETTRRLSETCPTQYKNSTQVQRLFLTPTVQVIDLRITSVLYQSRGLDKSANMQHTFITSNHSNSLKTTPPFFFHGFGRRRPGLFSWNWNDCVSALIVPGIRKYRSPRHQRSLCRWRCVSKIPRTIKNSYHW